MTITKKVRSNLLELKSELTSLLASITSIYSNNTLERFEIEQLYFLSEFIDEVILDKVDVRRANKEDIIYAMFIQFEIILGASKNKNVKKIVKRIKDTIEI